MRVVLDTNVLFAAFATRGLCDALIDACLESHQLVLSTYILNELHRNLQNKLVLPPVRADAIIAFLRDQAELVEPAAVPQTAFADESDLPILGTLEAARADCLVTGDAALLALKKWKGAVILTPRQFHERVAQ